MPDVVFSGLTGWQWLVSVVTAVTGLAAGWAAVLLLVYPVRQRGVPGLVSLQGVVPARRQALAVFATGQLLAGLSSPRRFFESLGPDRFRRELGRALKARIDDHVDDVMTRRNERSWTTLSAYARTRIYAHVHRRLPYVVDDFVDHIQHDLDEIIRPELLVRNHYEAHPEQLSTLFLTAFGPDLRAALPVAGLAGFLLGLPAAGLLHTPWHFLVLLAVAAAAGAGVMLVALVWPASPRGVWPLRGRAVVHRRQQAFNLALARQIADQVLPWPALMTEFLRGAHAGRVRYMMRREVAGILDVPMFRASMQLLLGPEGFAEVKSSAVEKAVEMLGDTPVSPALREHYRTELLRTLEHAAADIPVATATRFWQQQLAGAWRQVLPPVVAIAAVLGLAIGWLLAG